MTENVVVKTNSLTKRFGGVAAVKDLNLEIPRGTIFGFLGPNGAGKSTTISMLLGLIHPTAGSFELFGEDASANLPPLLKRTGAVVENSPFYPNLSGRDNMTVFARTLGNVAPARIGELLDMVGLGGRAKDKTRTYSLGMKQRLGIAIALLNDPELVILDEPSNGLDPSGIIEVRELIRSIGKQGKTVFLSSHLLHEVEQVCDQVAVIIKGKVIAQGRVSELLRRGKALKLRVSQPERAIAFLKGIEWVASAELKDGRLLVEAPAERAAELNALLVREGIDVSELGVSESTLEEFFLEAVKTDENRGRK
jgi:ABC-2 type transport system ATP-binding protein